jgi:hypothetical protein
MGYQGYLGIDSYMNYIRSYTCDALYGLVVMGHKG